MGKNKKGEPKMLNRIFKFVFPIVAVIFGIVAIVTGVHKLQTKDLYDSAAKAVITGIEREWTGTDEDGFDEYTYHVYVNYEVDGKKYENVEYPGYSSSMKNGDEIDILYQSQAPENISETNITGNATIFIVAGVVLTLVGLFIGIRAIIKR